MAGTSIAERITLVKGFLQATRNVVSTMCFTECAQGKPSAKSPNDGAGDVIGVIGLTGEKMGGSMAIVFPKPVVLHIVSAMLGEEYSEINEDVMDAVGEITNMISGGGRKALADMGHRFEMAIPSMIKGPCQINYHRAAEPVIRTPFTTPAGEFWLEVCFTA